MINTFAILLLLLLVILVYRKLNNRYQETKFRYKLHRLRYELRNLAIEKKVEAKSKEFDYTDFSLSKSLQESYYITLFYLISLQVKHNNAIKDLEHYKNIYESLNEKISNNKYLKEINFKRNLITWEYIMNQNKLTKFLLTWTVLLVHSLSSFKKRIVNLIFQVNYFPETSGIKSVC